jgi:hypothetical protein
MHGQFDLTAKISGNGKTLQVGGPVDFDPDEKGAVVYVTVTQDASEVTGKSGFTPSGKKAWSATIAGSADFVPGIANGIAIAVVHLTDGDFEPYPYPGEPACEAEITLN